MALNIAVPLSGVGDLLGENFNLMSPISLQSAAVSPNYDCRAMTKILYSPIDSESSGISSLDSEEIKKSSASSSPTDDEHNSTDQSGSTPSLIITSEISSDQKAHLLSPKPKHATATAATTTESIDTAKVEKTEDYQKSLEKGASDDANTLEENDSLTNDKLTEYYSIEEQQKLIAKLRIEINGRNILDLGANLNDNSFNSTNNNNDRMWQQQGFIRYAHLPENNLKMFLENRSQYHRLGANGHLQEYALVNCKCCDFIYPVNGYNNNSTSGNLINSVKTNINGQMAGDGNAIIKPTGIKSDLVANVMENVRLNEQQISPPTFSRPATTLSQNQYFTSSANNPSSSSLKQQCHEPNINFDNSMFNNNFTTALNRTVTNCNNQSNNILENIAAALLNTTNNNVSAINNGLNQKHFSNNTHHYFNNNHHAFGGNHHLGTNNHYASHSYSYKQF